MQENRFIKRVQERLSDGFSSPKLFTLSTYLGYVKQPMQENRFRDRLQEGLYIIDGFCYFKEFILTSYLGLDRLRNQCKRIDLESENRRDSTLLMASLFLNLTICLG